MRWRHQPVARKIVAFVVEGTWDMGHGTREAEAYLEPYRRAASRHGDGFASLLWANPGTQAARFDAICRLADMRRRRVLDAGCGRGDFIDFLMAREVQPKQYI